MFRRTVIVVAILALAACAQQTATTPSLPSTEVDYTAVGASDAIGYGASVACFPFTACPTGTGYVQDLNRDLQAGGRTVTLLNLGVPGAVLSPTIEAIGNALGRGIPANFLDGELPFVQKAATLVTIFGGANDVNTIGAALDAGLGGANTNAYIAVETSTFGADFNTLVSGIQARAPQARIVILNLPNMGALPFAAGDTADQKRALQQISVGFTGQINTLTKFGAIVLDLMCDPQMYQPNIYSSDGFHPNDAGYAYLAGLVLTAANTGSAAAPQSSCGFMFQF